VSGDPLTPKSGFSLPGAHDRGEIVPNRERLIAHDLIGRDTELEAIGQFILDSASGGSGLLLRGEAGVGKTQLLKAAVDIALGQGSQVARCVGVEFEADLAYSGLHELLLPFEDGFDDIGSTHGEALRVALGFTEGTAPGRLLLSNAVLRLFRNCSERWPLVIVVDDLHWIDRSSAAILGSVARRLNGTHTGFIAAFRDQETGYFDRSGVPELAVMPLSERDSRTLLERRFPQMGPMFRKQVVEGASGNPLALLELAEATKRLERPLLSNSPTALPLTNMVQTMYASNVASLPYHTREMLLLAVLEGTGDLAVLRRASGRTLGDLREAEQSRMITIDCSALLLRFKHPLIRSAVIDASSFDDRQRAHQMLAEALADDPDRRVWHLAEATLGRDEEIAQLLEESSYRTLGRGDAVGAVSTLSRAATMSPDSADRARRLAEAAYVGAAVIGEMETAGQLLAEVRNLDPDLTRSLEAATVASYLLVNGDGSIETAYQLLIGAFQLNASKHAPPAVLDAALSMVWTLCLLGRRPEMWESYHHIMDQLKVEMYNTTHLISKTFADPVRTAASVRTDMDHEIRRITNITDGHEVSVIASAAMWFDRAGDCRSALWRVVMDARSGNAVGNGFAALSVLCDDDFDSGRWDECDELASELSDLGDSLGYRWLSWVPWNYAGLVAAGRGDVERSQRLAADMLGWANPRGAYGVQIDAHHVLTLLSTGQGDFEGAYRHASAMSSPGTFASHVPEALRVMWDLVEAATKTGRSAQAEAHVKAMYQADLPSISPRLAMITAACAGLTQRSKSEAYHLFEKATDTPGAERWPFDLARIQLAFGERLRRDREVGLARDHLGAALEQFRRLCAQPWLERATNELRASGGHRHEGGALRVGVLTPQEQEVAELAASGMTNKDIAQRLYMSPRTVSSHLYKLFPKLDITSRAGLRDALDRIPADDGR
jgi:DNA-binding CsgD family transcriptional regulator